MLVSSVVAVASSSGVASVSTFRVLVSSAGDVAAAADLSLAVLSSSLAVTLSVSASDGAATSAPVDTVSRGLIPGYRTCRLLATYVVEIFVL